MGHTMVTRFDGKSLRLLHSLMDPWDANKIPFGRNCDRVLANDLLDYHVTLCHWPKNQDAYYLPRVQQVQSHLCWIEVTDVKIMAAEEGSWLLYFTVRPTPEFLSLVRAVEKQMGCACPSAWHITLAVDKDLGKIQKIRGDLLEKLCFPVPLQIDGVDLYHIWKPTKRVSSF